MSLSLRILGTALLDCIPEDQRIPLYLSPVTAGFPPTADDYVDQQINLHELLVHNSAATYFVRAVGDSMLGARVHDGDLLIVDRSAEARSGRVVIAVLIKRLIRRKGRVLLAPENPAYLELTSLSGSMCTSGAW
jgi:DNA polymerase V